MTLSTLDLLALCWFLAAWIGYSVLIDRSAKGRDSLTKLIAVERRRWMETMAIREHRIVDAALIGGLQQGTAFFASSSLIAIGGALSLMRASEEMTVLSHALPFAVETTRELWQAKVLGLAVIMVYAFFKFAWAYRLFNYTAILIGATPIASRDREAPPSPVAVEHAGRAAMLQTVAANDFNRGIRAMFFALGYLGWLVSPIVLLASTTAIVVVLYRRQFFSPAVMAVTTAASGGNAPGRE